MNQSLNKAIELHKAGKEDVTPQNVSVSVTGSSYHDREIIGKFAVVIQKIKLTR